MKTLGDGFIKPYSDADCPHHICTVVHGIADGGHERRWARVGLKALDYFEVVTTVALIVGLLVINIRSPVAA